MSKIICKDCHIPKEASEYYGAQRECKECTKARVKLREQVLRKYNPEWNEKEKKRQRKKYHDLGYKDLHKPTPEKKKETMAKYKAKYPEKNKARQNVRRKLKTPEGFENHHWSYHKIHWLSVIELSIADHNKLHRFIVYDQERMMYRRIDTNELLDTKENHLEYFELIKNKE